MTRRFRANSVGGLIEDNPLTAAATTLTSAGLAALGVVDATNHAAIVLDPDGLNGAPEIAYVTAHTSAATTATIARGQEGTAGREHLRDVPWVHSPTTLDFGGIHAISTYTAAGASATRAAATTIGMSVTFPFPRMHANQRLRVEALAYYYVFASNPPVNSTLYQFLQTGSGLFASHFDWIYFSHGSQPFRPIVGYLAPGAFAVGASVTVDVSSLSNAGVAYQFYAQADSPAQLVATIV